MNRIRTALKNYADRYLEAMAYADPAGLAYYAFDPIADDPRRSGAPATAHAADDAARPPTLIAA